MTICICNEQNTLSKPKFSQKCGSSIVKIRLTDACITYGEIESRNREESDLRGLSRKQNRDNIKLNQHSNFQPSSSKPSYRIEQPFVEESRASHPAWMY